MDMSSRITLTLGTLAICIALPLTGCIGRDLVGGAGTALTGDPFSADLVDPMHPDKAPTHIFFGNGKVRIESGDTSGLGALVLDPAKGTTLLINDKAKQYVDAGMFSRVVMVGAVPVLRVLRPAGSGDPCSQWNSVVSPFAKYAKRDDSKPAPVFTCRSLGSESVNGRSAHKWAVTTNDPDDKGGTIWIDDKLHIMARSQGDDGAMEIRNIEEGPQPEALFEAPAGYKKISVTSILGDLMKTGGDSASGRK